MSKNPRLVKALKVIKDWKLSIRIIAEKMQMGEFTLRMKIKGNDNRYRMTDSDLDRLLAVLRELATSITNI